MRLQGIDERFVFGSFVLVFCEFFFPIPLDEFEGEGQVRNPFVFRDGFRRVDEEVGQFRERFFRKQPFRYRFYEAGGFFPFFAKRQKDRQDAFREFSGFGFRWRHIGDWDEKRGGKGLAK